jgi:hypothetical protein
MFFSFRPKLFRFQIKWKTTGSFFFLDMSTQGEGGIRTSDLRFIRRDPQPIEKGKIDKIIILIIRVIIIFPHELPTLHYTLHEVLFRYQNPNFDS